VRVAKYHVEAVRAASISACREVAVNADQGTMAFVLTWVRPKKITSPNIAALYIVGPGSLAHDAFQTRTGLPAAIV
jgi:hypothetical protein